MKTVLLGALVLALAGCGAHGSKAKGDGTIKKPR
jgi:outer membrane lipopolysaccharide assembly protein LptE/RlpB